MDNSQFSEPQRRTDREIYFSSLLITEMESENIGEVKWLLLHKKADPNLVIPNQGVSPMHVLAGLENESFSVEVIEIAIEQRDGDPNVRSADGLTPVHLAAMWSRCVILEILLKFGGDPFLLEYKFSLNAEDLALKEHQWQAHAILATFSVFNDEHERLDNSYLHSHLCKPSTEKELPKLQVCKNAVSDFSTDCGDLISKHIKTQDINSNMSLGETECKKKYAYTIPQSESINSYEDSMKHYENNSFDEGNIKKQDKIRTRKKLSDQFAESFAKFKHLFGRTSTPKLGSDSSPKTDSKRNASKTSI